MARRALGLGARFALRALPWLAASAAVLLSWLWLAYLIPMAYLVWSEPTMRVVRITASAKPVVSVALVTLIGIAAIVFVSSPLAAEAERARRARAALGWLGAHTLLMLTAMVVSSPLRTEDQILASGVVRMRDAYAGAYAAGLCLWQAWAGAAFTALAVLLAPLVWRRVGAVAALRMIAAPLLITAPFSFAWWQGDLHRWLVLLAAPLWIAAEVIASRASPGEAPPRPTG